MIELILIVLLGIILSIHFTLNIVILTFEMAFDYKISDWSKLKFLLFGWIIVAIEYLR